MKIFRETDPPIAVMCFFSGCRKALRFATYSVAFNRLLCPAHWAMIVEANPNLCDACAEPECRDIAHTWDIAREIGWDPRSTGGMAEPAILKLAPMALGIIAFFVVIGRIKGWF